MAADQRRKRSNGIAVADVSQLERSRNKKRHIGSALENGLNMKSHISLEWDEKRKKVAAKKAQVGISWRELKPFVNSYPQGDRILADALDIPREIFQLKNLDEVLSYEVWQSYLSETERKYLMQFLPAESDAQQIVKPLLAGENFHFGNPFRKWSASLQSGNLHPDAVLHREKGLKDDKKAYYLDLEKYHSDVIGYLLKLKERYENCKDPEEEFNQNIWRSRKNIGKNFSSRANGSRFDDVEESVGATSESSSWAADEKASTSDNQNISMIKGGKPQRRMGKKGPLDRSRKPSVASAFALNLETKAKKGEKLRKRNIVYSDGAEYMSYVKISKKQHELAKSMEKSGSTVQSKSNNPVLGNLDDLDVKPYEVYLEEERKKLHEHWTRLAKEDLPSLYSAWRNIQSQRQCMFESLGKELVDKIDVVGEGTQVEEEESPDHMLLHKQGDHAEDDVPQEEDEVGSSSGLSQDDKESGGAEYSSGNEDDEEPAPASILQDQGSDTATLHSDVMKNLEQSSPPGFLEDQGHDAVAFHTDIMENSEEPVQGSPPDAKVASSTNHASIIDGDGPVPGSSNDRPSDEIPPLNPGNHTFNLVDLEVANNPFNPKSVNAPLPVPAYSGNLNSSSIMGNQAVPLSSGGDAWQSVNMADSYYGSDHPPANKQEEREWAALETDLCEHEAQKNLLHRQVNENSFKSFPDRGQNELLHSIFKGQDALSYTHEQKGDQTNFQTTNNVLMGNGRFSGQFEEQPRISLPLDQELKIQNNLYMQHNMSSDIFPDGDRFSMQRQEHLFPVNVQDWGVNSACGPTPVSVPPPLPGGDLSSQNWFSHEHQARGGWTNSDGVGASSQGIGNSVNLDQSLYSVLSHCNQLHPGTSYDSILPHTEHFIPRRDYGLVSGGLGNVPNINNVIPHTTHSLEYLNRREPPASLMTSDTGWMGMPNQNQNMNDPMGKPFLGSWNR